MYYYYNYYKLSSFCCCLNSHKIYITRWVTGKKGAFNFHSNNVPDLSSMYQWPKMYTWLGDNKWRFYNFQSPLFSTDVSVTLKSSQATRSLKVVITGKNTKMFIQWGPTTLQSLTITLNTKAVKKISTWMFLPPKQTEWVEPELPRTEQAGWQYSLHWWLYTLMTLLMYYLYTFYSHDMWTLQSCSTRGQRWLSLVRQKYSKYTV